MNRELKISHSGTSDVYLTGYTTHQFLTVESDSSGLSESDEEADEEDLDALLQGPRLRQSGARLIAVNPSNTPMLISLFSWSYKCNPDTWTHDKRMTSSSAWAFGDSVATRL